MAQATEAGKRANRAWRVAFLARARLSRPLFRNRGHDNRPDAKDAKIVAKNQHILSIMAGRQGLGRIWTPQPNGISLIPGRNFESSPALKRWATFNASFQDAKPGFSPPPTAVAQSRCARSS
jgi:hypothetical protein